MNVHALRLTQRLGFDYCSDGRGTHPHLPVWNAELIRCPQLPTTLPTLDELIGVDGVTRRQRRRARCSSARRQPPPAGHVFTLHAELEGMRLAPVLEQLLDGLEGAGLYARVDARGSTRRCSRLALPRCEVGPWRGPGPQRARCSCQGPEFLADVDLARAA